MRKLIRNFLNRYGYDIVKTGVPYIPKSNKDGFAKVGNYSILMPGTNVQLINYQLYPDLNTQLGRLAKHIFHKYPGMTVIDVGANVGDTVAVLKTAVDVPVIAVEGDDISYSYLEKNVPQFSNVTIIKTFLGEKSAQLNVGLEKSGWNTTVIPVAEGGKAVSFKSLDDVIAEQSTKASIKLLKVDVEGFDTIVLRGAGNIIREHQPVLFFEYNRQNMIAINEEGLSTILSFKEMGYHRIIFFDHKGALVLSTTMQNEEAITAMHQYISSTKNLLGYYDICIFHEADDAVASAFLKEEQTYL
jgi:FkbM family methyltransferase